MSKSVDPDQAQCSLSKWVAAAGLLPADRTYTVRHKLGIASTVSRKQRKLSSYEYFLVLFMKIDKVVTIYSKFRFDYHKGKQPGMVNAHLPLKMFLVSSPLWHFQNAKTCKV